MTMAALLVAVVSFAQSELLGKWQTFKDDKPQSVVEIYKAADGKYEGKVVALSDPKRANDVCQEGPKKGQKLVGMVIIQGMTLKGGELQGGTIYDPANGKTYYANISYDKDRKQLKLRGSIDKRGWLGRTDYWTRH